MLSLCLWGWPTNPPHSTLCCSTLCAEQVPCDTDKGCTCLVCFLLTTAITGFFKTLLHAVNSYFNHLGNSFLAKHTCWVCTVCSQVFLCPSVKLKDITAGSLQAIKQSRYTGYLSLCFEALLYLPTLIVLKAHMSLLDPWESPLHDTLIIWHRPHWLYWNSMLPLLQRVFHKHSAVPTVCQS